MLVVLSSGAVLVLEIVAVRLVAPFVGLTLETYSAAIGVALGGIAAGAALGGRAADRADPRGFLGLLVGVGGLLVLLTRPLVVLLGPLVGAGSAATVLLVLVAVAAPATVLSAVPPAVVKLQLRGLDDAGAVVGRLSALGTAGALAATFLTGFVLLGAVPLSALLLVVGGALLVGGAALHVALRNPVTGAVAATLLAGMAGGAALAGLPGTCDSDTAYYCVRVEAEGSVRTLVLDDLRHSEVDLADPTALGFRYVQRFGDAVTTQLPDGPVDALHVGGGGMTLPRWLSAVRPGSVSTVLELDEGVVATDVEQLGLVTGPDLRVRVGDARLGVAEQPADSADLVVGDAFGSRSVPWHLATREFWADVDRVLRPGGLVVVNVIDFPPGDLVASETATVADVFTDVALVARPGGRSAAAGNFVVVASDAPLDVAALRRAVQADGAPDDAPAAGPDVVLAGQELRRFVGDAPVLSDDFAPTDQLLTPALSPARG